MKRPEKNVLIIEDDQLLGPSLKDFLENKGFKVCWLSSGKDLTPEELSNFDLVVLDLILPDLPGEKVLEIIRNEDSHLPVIILTAKGTIENKEECFEKGADDYLTKPFDILELYLRIKALLRRNQRRKTSKYILGDAIIDVFSGLIIYKGRKISLSRRAWNLLLYLLKNRGRIVSKQEILNNVWKDAVVTEDSVRAYIKELRQVLPKDAIKTFKGRGYCLN